LWQCRISYWDNRAGSGLLHVNEDGFAAARGASGVVSKARGAGGGVVDVEGTHEVEGVIPNPILHTNRINITIAATRLSSSKPMTTTQYF
jgi:hypothetical protein